MDKTDKEPDLLQEALDWCAERGLVFDFVNANAPDRIAQYGADPRKVSVDLYIDDRSTRNPFSERHLWTIADHMWARAKGDIVAVDFDGTLCKDAWPGIGEPNYRLIDTLLKAQRRGVRLTLWTCREHPQTTKELEQNAWTDQHSKLH
jgi:hypothetical protein